MKQELFIESLINLLLPLGLIFGLVLLLSLNVGAGAPVEKKVQLFLWSPGSS
ncbi:hypothetical protein [Microcoleus sp. Pol12A6]|uniref:hypothetical protein n=1 Tax=Microcoleus sp. Pol12A6 TaxID=3055393 RepID=UPI002FD6DE5A